MKHFLKHTKILFAILIFSNSTSLAAADTTDVQHSISSAFSQQFQDYLGYQSTTVEMYRNYSTSRATANSPELHFLGGREYNYDIILNNLSFRNPHTGICDISFVSPFIVDVNSYIGFIPSRFSNVNSAVIELTIPEIPDQYQASFESLSDNLLGNSFDQNYYRGVVQGYLFDNNNLKFFGAFERRWLGDRMPSSLTADILPQSDGILPNNALSGWTYHGKLKFKPCSKSDITLSIDGSSENWQEYLHYFNNPDQPYQISHTPRYKDDTYGIQALLERKITEKTKLNLSLGYYRSEYLEGDGVIFDDYQNYHRYDSTGNIYSNPLFDMHNLFREGYLFTSGYLLESYYDEYIYHISTYKQIKLSLDHKIGDIHQLQVGANYKKYNLRYFNDLYPTLAFSPDNLNRYGFDLNGNESDNETWKNDVKQPTEFSYYFSDKLTLDKISIDVAIRFDRFDLDAFKIRNPERPFDPDEVYPSDVTLDESDMIKTETHTSFNPQIKFEFQATEHTDFYVSWNQSHQMPSFDKVYIGWDFVEERISSGSYYPLSSPSLEPERCQSLITGTSTTYKYIQFDFTIYSSEFKKQSILNHQSPGFPTVYDSYSNSASSSFEGANIKLQYDNNQDFGWFIDATKSSVTGQFPDYSVTPSIHWNSATAKELDYTLSYDQEYKLVTGLYYSSNFGLKLNLVAKQFTGYPYTPTSVYDAVTLRSVSIQPTGEINSTTSETNRIIDLKLEREFSFSEITLTPFIIIKNLLNEEFITGVYSGTGSPTSTGYLESEEGQVRASDPVYGEDFESRYQFAQNHPLNFYPPRQIFIGIKGIF